jgi:hypothetical protein
VLPGLAPGVYTVLTILSHIAFSLSAFILLRCSTSCFLTMSSTDAWIASLGDEPMAPSPLSQSMTGLSLTTAGSGAGSLGEYGGGGSPSGRTCCFVWT